MGTIAWTQGEGPLVPFADGYREALKQRGHRSGAVKAHLTLMSQLNRRVSTEGLGVEAL